MLKYWETSGVSWDFDSEASKKHAIVQMVNDLCKSVGGDSVSVCTFGTEGSRAALLTACRGLGLSNDVGQYLSSLIGSNRGFNYTIEDAYYGNADKDIPASKAFKEEIDKYPKLLDAACAFSGLVTRLGVHACFAGDTKVTVRNGVKEIKDIKVGDEVLTHTGEYHKVLETMNNGVKPLIKLKGKGFIEDIKTTKDHPFLVKRNDEIIWLEADKITQEDWVGRPSQDGYEWFKIDSKEDCPSEEVYNLSVDVDNSYIVNGVACHNCGVLLYNAEVYEMNAVMRSPKGTRISQFDLSDSEKMGSIKYDFLSTDALDKIHTCMDLLIKDDRMEWQGSLRATYNKYIHPDVLNRTEGGMWKMLNEGKIISAFQMDTVVAKQTLRSIHPTSLLELAAVNSLMRLVPEKGHKSPAEEYLEYKLSPQKLRNEINSLNATDKEKEILYEYLKTYNGVLESQENMMQITMIPEFTNFNFSEASNLRKIVA